MQRINVIGTSGSGKSVFSEQLAVGLGYPYLQMDQLYWLPNWEEPEDAVFLPKLAKALDEPSWVLDGNYSRTTHVKWRTVDTVIWLDYSFGLTLWRAIKRALRRIRSGEELWPGTGNVETWSRLFSKDSVVHWMIISHGSIRRRYAKMLRDEQYAHIDFHRFRHPKQARRFLEENVGLK